MTTTVPASSVASNKANSGNENGSMSAAAVTKRLQQELTSLMCGGGESGGVSAFPSGDSLYDWVGTITVCEYDAYQ